MGNKHLHVWGQWRLWVLTATFVWAAASAVSAGESPISAEAALAKQILAASGVRGGLIVHLGCGDGKLTAALRASEGCLVHGLDSDAAKVARARREIQSLGLYGSVAVERLEGERLPYVDNLVNLLVISGPVAVEKQEILRVLAPGGVAVFLSADKEAHLTQRLVKPRPAEIDEWTHFLHDASNNAVAADTEVGLPRQLQWVGDPLWARSHDHLASVSAAVCAGGRLFYIVDEGPIAAVVLAPRWQLVARDAFSGVILWKRPIGVWQWHLRAFRSGPSDLARRLVAVGERVYVTLGSDAPVSALDAATGETLRSYDGTEHASEIVCTRGCCTWFRASRPARRRVPYAGGNGPASPKSGRSGLLTQSLLLPNASWRSTLRVAGCCGKRPTPRPPS